jgi:hypothetical protein
MLREHLSSLGGVIHGEDLDELTLAACALDARRREHRQQRDERIPCSPRLPRGKRRICGNLK